MKLQSAFLSITPGRAALFVCAALAALHLSILGSAYRQMVAGNALERDLAVINANLDQAAQATQEKLASLREQLSTSKARLSELEEAAPELFAPFQVYRRSYDLARASGVELVGVHHEGRETSEGILGPIQLDSYHVEAAGGLSGCMDLVGRMEASGLGTIAVSNFAFSSSASTSCEFDVQTVGAGQVSVP